MKILFAFELKQLVVKTVKILVEIALVFGCVINHLVKDYKVDIYFISNAILYDILLDEEFNQNHDFGS